MKDFKLISWAFCLCIVAALSFAACGGHSHDGEGGHSHGDEKKEVKDAHAGHDHSGHDHSGHDHSGHDHSGHDHSGHDHSGHDHDDHAGHDHSHEAKTGPEYTSAYVCPMHCKGSGSDKAGKCPTCEMNYVANAEHGKDGHSH